MKTRIGLGYDVHQLEVGKDFWLGGIKLKAERGAVGHSDADVLIHAICDALLGAANLRDIGFHFSNTDNRWRGKESRFFLLEVVKMLEKKGWRIGNIDSTICLENPKINPHVDEMRNTLSSIMNISLDDISIKATTSEKIGFVGREEGVCAYAVVLINSV